MASAVIYATKSANGSQPSARRISEAATQTFLQGVPVTVSAGYVQEWNGTSMTGAIAGISNEPAKNRTTAGQPQVVNPASIAVQNQPNAVNISVPPYDDGRIGFYQSTQDTYFWGQVGPAQGPVSQANVGVQYGMTKDSDGHWYVDTSKTTVGTNTVLIVTGIDPYDSRGVFFQFLAAAQQQQ